MRFNTTLLNNFVSENNLKLVSNYDVINRNTKIEGYCNTDNCNGTYKKAFRNLYDNKTFYCEKCSKILKLNRFTTTCISKYGCITNLILKETQEKIKQTTLEKYGVDHNSKSDEIKYKRRLTCLKKYGKEYYSQTPEFKVKSTQTSLKNWGTEYPNQNSDVISKSSSKCYSRKDYILPSGSSIQIQGYEHYVLDELLKTFLESEIITGTKNVPEIWYTDNNNKKHRHYVDIFIPAENLCIEVKSTWTAKKKQDNIFLKQQAAKALGYKYEIWIYDGNGNCVEKYT